MTTTRTHRRLAATGALSLCTLLADLNCLLALPLQQHSHSVRCLSRHVLLHSGTHTSTFSWTCRHSSPLSHSVRCLSRHVPSSLRHSNLNCLLDLPPQQRSHSVRCLSRDVPSSLRHSDLNFLLDLPLQQRSLSLGTLLEQRRPSSLRHSDLNCLLDLPPQQPSLSLGTLLEQTRPLFSRALRPQVSPGLAATAALSLTRYAA